MGRVTFGEFSEGGGFDKIPDNAQIEVVAATYERIHKEAGTNKNTGKAFPARDYTAAVLTCVVPEGADPTKEYRLELGCGKVLLPSEDGNWLDDREATRPSEKLMNKNAGFAVFLQSLERAGAEDGTFTEESRQQIEENIQVMVGLKFHSSTEEKDGPEGKYKATVASRVYEFGGAGAAADEEPSDPDMEVVEEKIKALLSLPKNKAGLLPSELLKGLVGLSKAQAKKAADALSSTEWIEAAVEQGFLTRDAKTKRLKLA